MIALKEITKWDDNIANHTYILNEKKELIAYIKANTDEYFEFSKPIRDFSKSRRKFKEVKINHGGPF